MNARCMEYVKNNMNAALHTDRHTAFNHNHVPYVSGKFINMPHDISEAAVLTTSLVWSHTIM